MASAMLPAWHAAATVSRSHTRATAAPTAIRPLWSSSMGGRATAPSGAGKSTSSPRGTASSPWTSAATASRAPGAATGTSPRSATTSSPSSTQSAPGTLLSWGTRWVATPLCSRHACLATGCAVWCGSTRCARSATSRRHRPRTSPGSSRPSTPTSAPQSTGSLAACFGRVPTRRWSITSPEAWLQRRRKPPLDPSATPSTATRRSSPPLPSSQRPSSPSTPTCRRPTSSPSGGTASSRSSSACGPLLDARRSRPVQPCPRRDARLVLRLTRCRREARAAQERAATLVTGAGQADARPDGAYAAGR